MTVTFQVSDKRGDAILLVKAEGPGDQVDNIHSGFVAAAAAVGLQASVDAFDSLPGAVATVQAVFPGVTQTMPPAPPAPWGNPPVPPFQPPAPPQLPAAAAPQRGGGEVKNGACVHGAATYREAPPNSGKTWKAYFCPAAKGDPNQCNPEFIR